jgi:DNA excision repair protein ERCC-2
MQFTGASRALEGIRGHQKLQHKRPGNYTPEVSVTLEIECEGASLEIGGRIDGVFDHDGKTTIEEIKTTSRSLDYYREHENPYHWGQLQVYAYIYCQIHKLTALNTRLTYFQLDSGKILELNRSYRLEELKAFFDPLVAAYFAWAKKIFDWETIRNESIAALEFPFVEYRKGQRTMAVEVYRTIVSGGQLLVQAATGIGKTMGAIFPAIKAMGEGHGSKIFYLTARTTGRLTAENAFKMLSENGLRFKSITLTAKDKICFNPEATCTPEECVYAKGYFDRLKQAIGELFVNDHITRPAIEAAALKHRICPFEFSLEMTQWCDAIICDYNYAFDPRVFLRRFFTIKESDYIFLIDEAHNLVDRSREMFSAQINKQHFLDLRRVVTKKNASIFDSMGRINRWLLEARKRFDQIKGFQADTKAPKELYRLLRAFLKAADKCLQTNQKTDFREELLELYFMAFSMLRIADIYDEGFITCYYRDRQDLVVKLFCLDPSTPLNRALRRCRAAVFFSATLTPANYFQEVLGCGPDTRRLAIGSPFAADNLALFLASGIPTLYRLRKKSLPNVARSITELVRYRKGNYLAFFPSYEYLLQVHALIEKQSPDLKILVQRQNMSEKEREQFLERFRSIDRVTMVGFAVMGGIFGEGIDLHGEYLSGVVIIGVGLPGISKERELIREYYQAKSGYGFEFAYVYPGINRVLQAAGRVIRSDTDRGVVLLVDQRFASPQYRRLMPMEWDPVTIANLDQLRQSLDKFWMGTR